MRAPGLTPLLALLASLPVIAGCGSSGTSVTSYLCAPACPTGTLCTENGCVADGTIGGAPDLAVPGDLSGCSCSGATPYCGTGGQCVPCLEDKHCPIGQVCRPLGAVTVCAVGCTDDSRCDGGRKCCGGACLDVSSDAQNCGACGTVCSAIHSAATCAEGGCAAGACDTGWADCNKDGSDGCETNTRIDAANCGACGAACKVKNALPGCSGTCYVAACVFGFDDCNNDSGDGCETAVVSDPKNCGACGNSCAPPPHAAAACVNAACALARCDFGWADCDNNPQNGCEANIGTDAKNCGGCKLACAQGLICKNAGCTCPQCNFDNASSKCVNNVCVMDKCVDGFGDCNNDPKDGCETDVTGDAKNCGACGMVCDVNMPVCMMSACTNAICHDIGYANCPTGAKQWCDGKMLDGNDAMQALKACNTCYFQNGMGDCVLSNGDCAGLGYTKLQQQGPAWGYQAGCSGASGRVWEYGQSFTTYGRWAP